MDGLLFNDNHAPQYERSNSSTQTIWGHEIKVYAITKRAFRTRRKNEIFIPQARVFRKFNEDNAHWEREISGFNATNNKIDDDTFCFQLLTDFEIHHYRSKDYNAFDHNPNRCKDCYMECDVQKAEAGSFLCVTKKNEVFILTKEQYEAAIK